MERNLCELKNKLRKGNMDSVRSKCESYIFELVQNTAYSDTVYQDYCIYVLQMGILFTDNEKKILSVGMTSENEVVLLVNAVNVVKLFNSDGEILFGLAHEVKHLQLEHMNRYDYLLAGEVSSVFINFCTDVEVNELLKAELVKDALLYRDDSRFSAPRNMLDISTMLRMIGYKPSDVLNGFNRLQPCDLSSYLYNCLNMRCEEVLGYDASEIQERLKNRNTSFYNELMLVSKGMNSTVFNISNMKDARNFCDIILRCLS